MHKYHHHNHNDKYQSCLCKNSANHGYLTYLLKKIPFVELDFNDKIQKELYESVLVSVKRIRELNNVLEQRKDKASVSVIEAEKENLSKRIEDDITKIYNLKF